MIFKYLYWNPKLCKCWSNIFTSIILIPIAKIYSSVFNYISYIKISFCIDDINPKVYVCIFKNNTHISISARANSFRLLVCFMKIPMSSISSHVVCYTFKKILTLMYDNTKTYCEYQFDFYIALPYAVKLFLSYAFLVLHKVSF